VSIYTCSVETKGKRCNKTAIVAYYEKGWWFLCAPHADLINTKKPSTRATLIQLVEESAEDLSYRSLPRGEDR